MRAQPPTFSPSHWQADQETCARIHMRNGGTWASLAAAFTLNGILNAHGLPHTADSARHYARTRANVIRSTRPRSHQAQAKIQQTLTLSRVIYKLWHAARTEKTLSFGDLMLDRVAPSHVAKAIKVGGTTWAKYKEQAIEAIAFHELYGTQPSEPRQPFRWHH